MSTYYEPKKREFKGVEVLEELTRLLYLGVNLHLSFLNEYAFDVVLEVAKLSDKEKIEIDRGNTYLINYNIVVASYKNEAYAAKTMSYEEMDAFLVNVCESARMDRLKLKGE